MPTAGSISRKLQRMGARQSMLLALEGGFSGPAARHHQQDEVNARFPSFASVNLAQGCVFLSPRFQLLLHSDPLNANPLPLLPPSISSRQHTWLHFFLPPSERGTWTSTHTGNDGWHSKGDGRWFHPPMRERERNGKKEMQFLGLPKEEIRIVLPNGRKKQFFIRHRNIK